MSFKGSIALFKERNYRFFWIARLGGALAFQLQTVAVGWQMYALTGDAFYLGLVGLAQFLPMFFLMLVVGHVADSYDRKLIVRLCQLVEGVCVLALAWGSLSGWLTKEAILLMLFILGAAHAFEGPTMQALMPALVTTAMFPRAAALAAAAFQTATILGPALSGLVYAIDPAVVYISSALLFFSSGFVLSFVKTKRVSSPKASVNLKSLFAGINFIRHRPIILGAISLDMFAVLLGGATALLPIYAKDILHTGPWGLGLLRAAPSIGAVFMSLWLAHRPVKRHVGTQMFIAVAIFGISTIVFAISSSFLLSLITLIILGAADLISVVIRSSLVQLKTPDAMRGRVSAVNSLFIGTSNQLGEFESGVTAALFGAIPAVIIGGVGTLVVISIWLVIFPALAKADRLVLESEGL